MTGYRLLVVDDDPLQREILEANLRLSGYHVTSASSGREALGHMSTELPDLVLLDVQMPEMDGFQVLERMKSSASMRDVPVMFLTGVERMHVKVRGLELGAEDYISKSCGQAELMARIRAGLRRAARYRTIESAVAGDLRQVGIDTLLQTLDIGGKAATIRLLDSGAELTVCQGMLCACRFRRFNGAQALQRILLFASGRFTADFGPARQTEQGLPIAHALVDAAVAVDDTRRALSRLSGQDALLVLQRAPTGNAALEALRPSFPLRLLDLVVSLEGDIRTNAQLAADAFESGIVSLAV